MALSVLSVKSTCATCGDKSVGIFKCEGCSQKFCRKHSNEHRDFLTHQLDNIVIEHDILQHTMNEQKNKHNDRDLIEQINQWERESILKIQQAAHEARQQLQRLISNQTNIISSELHDLAERLRKAREDDDFVEADLREWTTKLQELKLTTPDIHRTVIIDQDPSTILVTKINITTIDRKPKVNYETLMGVSGNVQIQDNGRKAFQPDNTNTSYVRGSKTYSNGQHKIRFTLNKIQLSSLSIFGIISKIETLLMWQSSCYGWANDDTCYHGGVGSSKYITTKNDFHGKNFSIIELLLDCDNRMIQYYNEQTKNTRKLNINLEICPFPWQIFFYFHSTGDCVQLL
ncbi:unnamed protein product [Adineta steineri]|uniref:B box-type domain-containing protein n=1 Tax=Adineta steineri TaxID=433720 RepID=A0A813W077_9BILA|nr:unnamed protein product [Adineta steineri]CAF3988985.1 unnamed protein product [Adineta steineri]